MYMVVFGIEVIFFFLSEFFFLLELTVKPSDTVQQKAGKHSEQILTKSFLKMHFLEVISQMSYFNAASRKRFTFTLSAGKLTNVLAT